MEPQRRKKIFLRWIVLATLFTILFWGAWLANGGWNSIPAVSQVQIAEGVFFELPFKVSRLADIIFAPIWALLIAWVFTKGEGDYNEEMVFTSVISATIGLSICLATYLAGGMALVPTIGLFFNIIFAVFLGLALKIFDVSFTYSRFVFKDQIVIAVDLGFGLAFGLLVGLCFGFVMAIIFFFLFKGIEKVLDPHSWRAVRDFLTADKEA